jgi:hypothetical protein
MAAGHRDLGRRPAWRFPSAEVAPDELCVSRTLRADR